MCASNRAHTLSIRQPKYNSRGQWLFFPLIFLLSPSVCCVTLPPPHRGPPPPHSHPRCPLWDICRGRLCGLEVGRLSGVAGGSWKEERAGKRDVCVCVCVCVGGGGSEKEKEEVKKQPPDQWPRNTPPCPFMTQWSTTPADSHFNGFFFMTLHSF